MSTLRATGRAGIHARDAAWYVTAGQMTFIVMLTVCVAMKPGIVIKRDEAGLSNYGIHAVTVVPYTVAFVGLVVGAVVGASRVGSPGFGRWLRIDLRVYALLMTAVLLSTYEYSLNSPLRILHDTIGSISLTMTAGWAVWLFRRSSRSMVNLCVTIVTIAGYLIAAITLAGAWHLLFAGQAAASLGFAIILSRATREIDSPRPARTT